MTLNASLSLKGILIPFLKSFEGFSASPYRCPGGFQTVGYGHRIRPKEAFSFPISPEIAEVILWNDINHIIPVLDAFFWVPLSLHQRAALLSFTFNVGTAALQRSTLRLKVNREEHEAVPQELMKWIWVRGQPSRGLRKRRFAEGSLYNGY